MSEEFETREYCEIVKAPCSFYRGCGEKNEKKCREDYIKNQNFNVKAECMKHRKAVDTLITQNLIKLSWSSVI